MTLSLQTDGARVTNVNHFIEIWFKNSELLRCIIIDVLKGASSARFTHIFIKVQEFQVSIVIKFKVFFHRGIEDKVQRETQSR